LELGETTFEALEINGVNWVNSAEHHRLHFLKAGQYRCGICSIGYGVPHFHITRAADVGSEIAGLARSEAVAGVGFGVEAANLFHLDGLLRMMEAYSNAGSQFPIKNAHVNNHAFVWIVN